MQLVFFVFSSKDDRGRPKNDCHTHKQERKVSGFSHMCGAGPKGEHVSRT